MPTPVQPPARRPDFSKRFPNEAAFRLAKEQISEIAATISKNTTKMQTSAARDAIRSLADDSGPSNASGVLKALGPHRISDYLCSAAGARIVPSCHGRIEHMLLTIPSYAGDDGKIQIDPTLARHYQTLITNLGNDRHFTVLCHPITRKEIEGWFSALEGVTFDFAFSPRFAYTMWAQDAYIALTDRAGRSILSESVVFDRDDDMSIADDIAAQTDIATLQSYLYFEGGNLLGGSRFSLIGEDYIWQNRSRVHLDTDERVLEAFEQLLQSRVVRLGSDVGDYYDWYNAGILSGLGNQPIFHIDMYVTPTGKIGESGKEIVMLGRPAETHRIIKKYTETDDVDGATYDSLFDATERQLEQEYEVRRLPLLLTKGNLGFSNWETKYYCLSFNNVVIESDSSDLSDRGTVIMPSYSQDAGDYGTDAEIRIRLENAAADAWSDAGFDVRFTDGLEDLAYGDGSAHCITKALKRGNFAVA